MVMPQTLIVFSCSIDFYNEGEQRVTYVRCYGADADEMLT
jgi:hypothetical protein